jgi:hypothetical protein
MTFKTLTSQAVSNDTLSNQLSTCLAARHRTTPGLSKKEQEKQALSQKFAALVPEEPPKGRPFYDTFDSYAKDFPEGEAFRVWLTQNCKRLVMLLMSDKQGAPHNGMPGHYLAATLSEYPAWKDKTKTKRILQLSLRDCDDGLAVRFWPVGELADAERVLEEMKQLAPFTLWDAVNVFGLKFE